MKSIRARLSITLLGGLLALFFASGLGLYGYLRHTLVSSFDEGLLAEAQFFADTTEEQADGTLELDSVEPNALEHGRHQRADYFQAWGRNGQTLLRSPLLGARDLPRAPLEDDFPQFRDTLLPDGNAGRDVTLKYSPRASDDAPKAANREQHSLTLAFASSRRELDGTLRHILEGLFIVGSALILCVMPAVWWAVRRGLYPLRHISERTRMIGAQDLSLRFNIETMPEELVPVCRCLNDLLQRLEGAFALERRFTADAAHELRTPIAELRALAEVGLAEAEGGWPEMTGYFEDALGVACHLENLVGALLALTRCESGIQKIDLRPVDLAELTRETWITLHSKVADACYEVQLDMPEHALVSADPDLLRSVLANLLSNSLSYTPAGGRIDIAIRRETSSWVVRIANATSQIQTEDLKHVFEPFWRKHVERSEADHCGLGLSLVAAYARLMAIPLRAEITSDNCFLIEFQCRPTA
ncbi:MAG: ATP-binding protein [Candidatus Hydrogenedentes bacterium]|nr:ATP-binding protein [Candidatus Hydrogenedentota bacterium]